MASRELISLREQIATLQAERNALRAFRYSRKEARDLVEAEVSRLAQHAQKRAGGALREFAMRGGSVGPLADVRSGGATFPASAVLGPLLAALLGEKKLAAFLLTDIDSIPEGLDKAERAARLNAIAAELDDLERQEEALIEQAEAEGAPLLRRVDARPEIIIGERDAPKVKPYVSTVTDVDPYASKLPIAVTSPYLGTSRK